jgi:hypothetical protein
MPNLKIFLVFAAIALLFSCATRLPTPEGIPAISISNYEQIVHDKTQKIEIYDGLYNKLTVQATWLDSLLTESTLSHNARLAQWTQQRYQEERSKKISKNAESTEFFVSLYTPERKHADLANNKTLWKVFLDVDGRRFEGKATKVKLLLSEIQAYYPQHNRWSVPYYVTFPVATSLVENKPATLILTGAVGSAELNYK